MQSPATDNHANNTVMLRHGDKLSVSDQALIPSPLCDSENNTNSFERHWVLSPANGKNPHGVAGASNIARLLSTSNIKVASLYSSDVCRAKQTTEEFQKVNATPSYSESLAPLRAGGSHAESVSLLTGAVKQGAGTVVAVSHSDMITHVVNDVGFKLNEKIGVLDAVVLTYDKTASTWKCEGVISDWSKIQQ